ncbi:MAG: sigma-70 family RNA polymerase sigma factor [Chloroflexota bacterium]
MDSDEVLAGRCQRGDMTSFTELVNRYKDRVFNLALRMLHNRHDAEDLAQETFLNVYRAIASFHTDERFSTWIYKIASNLCIDRLRKRRYNSLSLDAPVQEGEELYRQIPDWSHAPEPIYEQSELREDVQAAIDQLPAKYRMIILLRHMQDMAYEEIAVIMDLPIGTVKTRLFRAREILRRHLERIGQENNRSHTRKGEGM